MAELAGVLVTASSLVTPDVSRDAVMTLVTAGASEDVASAQVTAGGGEVRCPRQARLVTYQEVLCMTSRCYLPCMMQPRQR